MTDDRWPMQWKEEKSQNQGKIYSIAMGLGHYYLPGAKCGTNGRASKIRNLSQHSQSNSQPDLTVTNCYRSVDNRRSRGTFGICVVRESTAYESWWQSLREREREKAKVRESMRSGTTVNGERSKAFSNSTRGILLS